MRKSDVHFLIEQHSEVECYVLHHLYSYMKWSECTLSRKEDYVYDSDYVGGGEILYVTRIGAGYMMYWYWMLAPNP